MHFEEKQKENLVILCIETNGKVARHCVTVTLTIQLIRSTNTYNDYNFLKIHYFLIICPISLNISPVYLSDFFECIGLLFGFPFNNGRLMDWKQSNTGMTGGVKVTSHSVPTP